MTTAGAEPHFPLFSASHCAALLATVLASAGVVYALRASPHAGRRGICAALAALMLANAIWGEAMDVLRGDWRLAEHAPLHLCDLAALVAIAALACAAWSEQRSPVRDMLADLTWFWGLAGTPQALLTPMIDDVFPSVGFWQFFIAHGAIVAAAFALTFGVGWRPRAAFPLRVWLWTNAILPPIALFNWLSGGNYLFLCGPPPNPSLYDHLGRWPLSLLSMEILGYLLAQVLFRPFRRK